MYRNSKETWRNQTHKTLARMVGALIDQLYIHRPGWYNEHTIDDEGHKHYRFLQGSGTLHMTDAELYEYIKVLKAGLNEALSRKKDVAH